MTGPTVAILKDRLRILERLLGWEFGDQSECCGLTNAQRTVVLEVGGKGRASLVDLVQSLGLDASTLSRTINGLVNIGLVRREIKAEDRRYITLTLTPQGKATYRRIENLIDGYFGEALGVVPAAKHKGMVEGLSLLADALGKIRKRGEACVVSCSEKSLEGARVREKKQ